MSVWFINTDAKSNAGHSFHDQWFARSIAVTSGPPPFLARLERIAEGDTVLMYVNGVGVVAIGRVIGTAVKVTTDTVSPREPHEYHRQVDWYLDLRDAPLTASDLKAIVGQTPLQTVQQVRKGRASIEDRISSMMKDRAGKELPLSVDHHAQGEQDKAIAGRASGENVREPSANELWIEELVSCDPYVSRRDRLGRMAPSDDIVRRCLRALYVQSGTTTLVALARQLGIPVARVAGIVAGLGRLLNIDGYEVVSFRGGSETLVLNVEMLRRQFRVTE